MSLEDAIALIRAKYEDNKAKKWIKKPVAYTLHEVWEIADSDVVLKPSIPTPCQPYDLLREEGGVDV